MVYCTCRRGSAWCVADGFRDARSCGQRDFPTSVPRKTSQGAAQMHLLSCMSSILTKSSCRGEPWEQRALCARRPEFCLSSDTFRLRKHKLVNSTLCVGMFFYARLTNEAPGGETRAALISKCVDARGQRRRRSITALVLKVYANEETNKERT